MCDVSVYIANLPATYIANAGQTYHKQLTKCAHAYWQNRHTIPTRPSPTIGLHRLCFTTSHLSDLAKKGGAPKWRSPSRWRVSRCARAGCHDDMQHGAACICVCVCVCACVCVCVRLYVCMLRYHWRLASRSHRKYACACCAITGG